MEPRRHADARQAASASRILTWQLGMRGAKNAEMLLHSSCFTLSFSRMPDLQRFCFVVPFMLRACFMVAACA
eukprot:COSAG04_NODE_4532_length_2031_cov_1.245342_2_plen_71_part_01